MLTLQLQPSTYEQTIHLLNKKFQGTSGFILYLARGLCDLDLQANVACFIDPSMAVYRVLTSCLFKKIILIKKNKSRLS